MAWRWLWIPCVENGLHQQVSFRASLRRPAEAPSGFILDLTNYRIATREPSGKRYQRRGEGIPL